MDKPEIVKKIGERKNKNGFVTLWRKTGDSVSGIQLKADRLLSTLDEYQRRGIEILDVTTPGSTERPANLNEQVAAYLAIEEEKQYQEYRAGSLDEQFWKRDA